MLAGRLVVPEVHGPASLDDVVAHYQTSVMLTRSAQLRLAEVAEPQNLTLLIGPEGGWSERELALLPQQATLGPRNLRADTAALVALSTALARQDLQVDIFTRRTDDTTPDVVEMERGVRVILVDAGPPEPLRIAMPVVLSDTDATLHTASDLAVIAGMMGTAALAVLVAMGLVVAAGGAVPGVERVVSAAGYALLLAIACVPWRDVFVSVPFPGVFGGYADLSADLADMAAELPPVGGGWQPVDAATVEGPATAGGWQTTKLEPGTPVEWGSPPAYARVLEVDEAGQSARAGRRATWISRCRASQSSRC